MEIPSEAPKNEAPQPINELDVVDAPQDEWTQADWDRQRPSTDDKIQAEALRREMRARRPEFTPDRDDGRL